MLKEMWSRRLVVVVVAVALVCAALASAACGGGVGVDESQREVREPDARPLRIVSLSPSTTEMLYGVGAFDRVVAVSDYCNYPPEVKGLPRVGGWSNPNLEQIASLRPDLVVMADAPSRFVKDKMEAMGISTLALPDRTLEDVYTAIERLGEATGNVEESRRLLAETRSAVEAVRMRTRDLPRKSVLCVVDRVPGTLRDIYTAAEGTFIEQLIEAAGGDSVAPPAQSGWGKLQKEALISLDPDVIIDLMMHEGEGKLPEDTLEVWSEMSSLRAVREGRVYALRDETIIHPSQFVASTARKFADLIHPEPAKANESKRAKAAR